MARSTGRLISLVLCTAFVAAAVGCSSGTTTAPVAPEPAESPEASLVEQRCTMCHTTDRIFDKDYDAAKWASTIERMQQNGLVISGDEQQSIIDYLVGRSAQ